MTADSIVAGGCAPPIIAPSFDEEMDKHEAACRAGTIIPDKELVQRAVGASVRRAKKKGVVAWGQVSEDFSCGSTVAMGLCRRFGHDPHKSRRAR